jgi:hypothetical protein
LTMPRFWQDISWIYTSLKPPPPFSVVDDSERESDFAISFLSRHSKMMYVRLWILWTSFFSGLTDIFTCSIIWLRPVVVDVWMSDFNFESILGAFEWYLEQGGPNLGPWVAGWFVVAHKPHSARHEGICPTEVIASPILTIVIKWRWMGQLHDGAVLTLGLWIPIWARWHTTYFNIRIEWCDSVWPLWPRMLKMLGHLVVEW